MDEVEAAVSLRLHVSGHEVYVVCGDGFGVLGGLEAAGVGHVVARGGVAQLVVLVGRREGEIPCGGIVGHGFLGSHGLPL